MRRAHDIVLPSGETLAASLELPAHEPRGAAAVLLCHGFSGQKSEEGRLFVRLARALATSGIVSLRFDFRGSGDSDGDFDELTLERELDDARAALAALAAVPSVDPARCAVLGLSLGSTIAMLLAGEMPPKALVLWAPLTAPDRLFSPIVGLEPRPGWQFGPAFPESCARARPLESLARYRGPVLCVRGRDDFLPVEWAEAAFATSHEPSSALELVEGDHTFGNAATKARVIELTRGWFVATLGAASTTR